MAIHDLTKVRARAAQLNLDYISRVSKFGGESGQKCQICWEHERWKAVNAKAWNGVRLECQSGLESVQFSKSVCVETVWEVKVMTMLAQYLELIPGNVCYAVLYPETKTLCELNAVTRRQMTSSWFPSNRLNISP